MSISTTSNQSNRSNTTNHGNAGNTTNHNNTGNATNHGNATSGGNATSNGNATSDGNATNHGNATSGGNATSNGNATSDGNATNHGNATSDGNATSNLRTQLERSLGIETRVDATRRDLLYPELSHAIVGACIEVHRHVGPGQLESVYQLALSHELRARRLASRAQVPLAMTYKGQPVGEFYADFIVDDKIVIELKAVERMLPVHTAQVLSYLRAAQLRLGLLINFNVPVLFRGVKRIVL